MSALPTSGVLSFGFERSAEHVHQGVDLVAPERTSVFAPVSGTIEQASAGLESGFSGYGGHVVLRTNESKPRWLLFAHLWGVDVTPGESVVRGQALGSVGRTCYTREDPGKLCDGAHLHFEVSPRAYPQDSEAARLDPVAWLAKHDAHPLVAKQPAEPRKSTSTAAAVAAFVVTAAAMVVGYLAARSIGGRA